MDRPTVDADDAAQDAAAIRECDARPTTVGRYVVLDVLGVGGMGVVHTAYDPKLDRKIALKILHDKGQRSGTGRARMVREAQALARLNHPNIVTVHDVDIYDGRLFIAMEYVQGVALDQWLEEKARPWREIVAAFVDAGRGLAAAHAAGITHRDFKPGNAVVGTDHRVRVLDFGLAKTSDADDALGSEVAEGAASSARFGRTGRISDPHVERLVDGIDMKLTQAGRAVGTPAFMSPEQLFGLAVDPATDQFSFAVALYESLYGKLPFADENAPDFLRKISAGVVREPPQGTAVPGWVHRALLRALRTSPNERFGSMDALLDALTHDPARRTRRIALGVGVAALVGMAGYGVVQGLRQPAAVCTGAGDKLQAAWSPAIAQAVHTAFEATGVPYAAHAWGQVQGALDPYTEQWVAQHQAICEATNVRREQSPTLMDVRMACLDRARAQLTGLVAELQDADAALVSHAVAAVQALPDLRRCTTEQPGQAHRDASPQAAAERDALQADLATTQGVVAAGRADRALPRTEALLVRARALGDPGTLAQALYARAESLARLNRFGEALPLYTEAVRAAREAGGVELEVRAWGELMYAEGVGLEHIERALAYFVAAQAAVALLHQDEARASAHLQNSHGTVLQQAGRYEEAEQALRASAELFAAADPGPNVQVANVSINRAVALDHLGRRADAIAQLQEAEKVIETLLGEQHPRMGMVATNLGNMLNLANDHQAARVQYERSLSTYRAVYGPQHVKTANALIGLASVEKSSGNLPAARARAQEALAVLHAQPQPPRTQIAITENMLGRIEMRESEDLTDPVARLAHVALAAEHHKAALAEYAAVYGTQPHPRVAATHAELCRTLRLAADRDAAAEHCRAALAIRAATGNAPLEPTDAILLGETGMLAQVDADARELSLWGAHQWYEAHRGEAEHGCAEECVDYTLALAQLWWQRPPARLRARAMVEDLADRGLTGLQRDRARTWLAAHPTSPPR